MKLTTALTLTCLMIFAANTTFAADIAADFDINNNPSPSGWSYGATNYGGDVNSVDSTSFSVYPEAGQVIAFTGRNWYNGGGVDSGGGVGFNDPARDGHSGAGQAHFGIDWDPLEVDFVPDQGQAVVSTARYEISAAGSYDISYAFADNQGTGGRDGDAWVWTSDSAGGSAASLYHEPQLPGNTNNTPAGRAWVGGADTVALNAGDFVYFASGKGASGGDHAVVQASVNLVPEPSTLLLAMLSVLGLIGISRRSRR